MTKKRRNLFCARILCASILFSLAAPVSAEETASAVSVEAPEYVLMEPETGTVILEKRQRCSKKSRQCYKGYDSSSYF